MTVEEEGGRWKERKGSKFLEGQSATEERGTTPPPTDHSVINGSASACAIMSRFGFSP